MSNILLDTHILLWALEDSPKLPKKAKKVILNENNSIYVSVLSLWEIEIKCEKRPDIFPLSAEEIAEYCKQAGYETIPLKDKCIYKLHELKQNDQTAHKDPFDRMLICQAEAENMKLLTHDGKIKNYISDSIMYI